MKFLIFLFTLTLSLTCQPDAKINTTTFKHGIGLLISKTESFSIYSDIECTLFKDSFNSYPSGTGRIFGKVKSELTNYKNFEFGYEAYFLPVIEVLNEEQVFKIIYQNSNGKYSYGYVSQPDNNKYQFDLWSNFLVDKPLFFIDELNFKIFEYNNGPEIELEKVFFSDHIMWPEFENDGWMQVKLVTPSDYCLQKVECSMILNGVIKYVDENGNLMVWYHTRGC